MRKLSLLTLMFIVTLAWNAKAQDSTAAAADDGKLTLSGYIDTYYNHAFNNPKSNSTLGNGGFGAGRAFDRTVDQFSLGLVQFKAGYSSSKVDIVADLTFGPNAEMGNFGNVNNYAYSGQGTDGPVGVNLYQHPTFGNLYGSSASIKQAYGTWKATEKFSVTVGQFGTHIGYEVIDAPVNFHYSLSNLFNNGPFYHVGAKATYAFSSKVAVMAGLVNNWDNLFDNNKQKSFIGQIYIKPIDKWNVYVNYIGGSGDDGAPVGPFSNFAASSPVGNKGNYNRHLWDLTTGFQVTDKFYVGLNAAYGYYVANNKTTDTLVRYAIAGTSKKFEDSTKNKADWGGVAVYLTYALNDWLSVGVRAEHFEDFFGVRYMGGFGGVGSAINNSITITAPITLANGHFIVKPEFRFDGADQKIYENSRGEAINEQKTIGLATIFKW